MGEQGSVRTSGKGKQVVYQPILRSLSGRLAAVEAVPASVDEVCKDLAARQRRGLLTVPVVLPLSHSELADPELPARLGAAVERCGLDPSLICVQVSESELAREDARTRATLRELHAAGHEIWLDGFESLALSQAELMGSLIDRAVIGMPAAQQSRDSFETVFRSLMLVCKDLGVHTVAKGAQDLSQLHFLLDAGCDEIQSPCFGNALTAEQAAALESPIPPENPAQRELYDKLNLVSISDAEACGLV